MPILRTEALWIGGDGERGFGRRLHEQVIDDALVLISDIAQLTGQRVDNVEVADGQQLGFARGEPFLCRRALALRAVAIAATVVADDGVSTRTVLATRDMTSECCRAAALDRTHHLHLVEAHMPRVSQTPSGAVVAEDVPDLQRWSNHNRRRYAGGPSFDLSLRLRIFRCGRDSCVSGLSTAAIMPVATRV